MMLKEPEPPTIGTPEFGDTVAPHDLGAEIRRRLARVAVGEGSHRAVESDALSEIQVGRGVEDNPG
jgi:hypothetical protein